MNESRKIGFDKVENLPIPKCTLFMQAKYIEYIPGGSLTFSFPVLEDYLNPGQTMQGGFITAAFDNVFGPLSLLEMKSVHIATTNLTTSYHRPIFAGDELKITATVKAKGRKKIHMLADGYNGEGKLVASASSDYLLLEPK